MYQATNVVVHALSETISPLTHMMGVQGNESVINRERVNTPDGVKTVPVISGNALRHRCVREPGAKYLIGRYNLTGNMTIDQLNYMLNGGSLTESSATENMRVIGDMQEIFPLFRLLGGSLRNQVVGGSLDVLRGVLVCEENRSSLSKMLPDGYDLPVDSLLPSETYVSQYQYTRGDARRTDHKMLGSPTLKITEQSTLGINSADGFVDDIPGEKSNLMIYAGQTVIPGALWYHGFVCKGVSPLEVGALLHSLQRWQNMGGTIGGQARIGHGRLVTSIWCDSDGFDAAEFVKLYIEHVDSMKDRAVEWLNATLGRRQAVAKKGAKL